MKLTVGFACFFLLFVVACEERGLDRLIQQADGEWIKGRNQSAIEISLRAGQASIHHPLTIHGSGDNTSSQWRYGIGFNYVSANTKVKNGHVESGLLVRGRPPTNGLRLETMPDDDLSHTALAAYGDALSSSSKRYADA